MERNLLPLMSVADAFCESTKRKRIHPYHWIQLSCMPSLLHLAQFTISDFKCIISVDDWHSERLSGEAGLENGQKSFFGGELVGEG